MPAEYDSYRQIWGPMVTEQLGNSTAHRLSVPTSRAYPPILSTSASPTGASTTPSLPASFGVTTTPAQQKILLLVTSVNSFTQRVLFYLTHERPLLQSAKRRPDWEKHTAEDVLRILNASDSQPGAMLHPLTSDAKASLFAYGAHLHKSAVTLPPPLFTAFGFTSFKQVPAGTPIATRLGAVLFKTAQTPTSSAAICITHGRVPRGKDKLIDPKIPMANTIKLAGHGEILDNVQGWTQETNGACTTQNCRTLLSALQWAADPSCGDVKVLAFITGDGYVSNGIAFNPIEYASSPGQETWDNICAIDDRLVAQELKTKCEVALGRVFAEVAGVEDQEGGGGYGWKGVGEEGRGKSARGDKGYDIAMEHSRLKSAAPSSQPSNGPPTPPAGMSRYSPSWAAATFPPLSPSTPSDSLPPRPRDLAQYLPHRRYRLFPLLRRFRRAAAFMQGQGKALSERGIVTVACVRWNTAAGGVALATACDVVLAGRGVGLNPSSRGMGLHGSELHSFSYLHRCGPVHAAEILREMKPLTHRSLSPMAPLSSPPWPRPESAPLPPLPPSPPLHHLRKEELSQMLLDSFYPIRSERYHICRYKFVRKSEAGSTPARYAVHEEERRQDEGDKAEFDDAPGWVRGEDPQDPAAPFLSDLCAREEDVLGSVGGLDGKERNCNIITGEEWRIVDPDSGLLSCTVEILPLGGLDGEPFNVVVIDEMQMLGDENRGGSWAKAILGTAAKDIHLYGDETTVELLRGMITSLGDTLAIHEYNHLTPLLVGDASIENEYSKIEDGDCVVTFSRSCIFNLERVIESQGKKCAVVYGALSPETRAEQAKGFTDENGLCKVLVDSDAVGKGLNFAGRAGRFKTGADKNIATLDEAPFSSGYATTFKPADLPVLRKMLDWKLPPIARAKMDIPTISLIELAALLTSSLTYGDLVKHCSTLAKLPPSIAVTDPFNKLAIADVIKTYRLSLSIS
ncbi:hypothetical protein L198_07356 [Cryptococcus wingfieldii CBS 7118]|uniref:Uncharacterized protein n=1 Tax=Cryptococcus wingfieldii CBS 7118 TaxID=1295528 RepID=A0A1E3ICK5_9TREE|nr:hypothetical protein L198_07356 [Cryptococcus wingfieldii CBS 7118]ODN86337.1 hypothetical protein L198_07356 [Cryptococcus wingfieldii CBS 7118]